MVERWLSEIEAIGRDARVVLGGLTSEQANQQPRAGSWSVAQCLAHVARTALPYLERIESALQAPARNGAVRSGILAGMLQRSMEPPPRMRMKTLRSLEPAENLDIEQTLADFDAAHERLASLLRGASEDAFVRCRFRSPFLPLISVRVDQGVNIMLAHARRHLWQARQVRRAVGVPG
jgi:DinB superfamily